MTCADIRLANSQEPRLGLTLLMGLILLVAGGKAILFDTLDPDCFWHLRVAEQLRAEGIGPLTDRLSFGSTPEPWTPYSWLAELGMAGVWRIAGWQGAVAVQAILQAAFVAFIAMACRTRPARPNVIERSRPRHPFTTDSTIPGALESVVATAVGAFLSLAYLSFRPVTAALVLMAACGWLIVRDRRSGERTAAVWLLAPITVLLINIHLYAILVPMWVAALLVGAWVERQGASPEDRTEADRRIHRYGWLLLSTMGGCLATPMLPGVIGAAFHYQSGDPMVASGLIAEMQPFYHSGMGKIAAVLVSVLTAFALVNRTRLRIGECLWFAVATALLFRLGRFAPAFAIVACPMFARTMPALSSRILLKPAVCALMAAVLLGGLIRICIDFPRASTRFDAWVNRHGKGTPGYPCAAADFVASHVAPISAQGRLINEFTWGGYLEWRLGDRYQTFLDGRTQLFSPDFWHATYLDSDDRRAAYLSRVHADAALLPIEHSVFQQTLLRQGWHVAYQDDRAQVLLPPVAKKASPPWPFAGGMNRRSQTRNLEFEVSDFKSQISDSDFNSHLLGVLGNELRHGVMLHQELPQLRPFGDQEMHRLVQLARGEVNGPDEVLRAGGHLYRFEFPVHRKHVELPRLPATEHPQAIGIDLTLVEIDHADGPEVLLDPRVLDRFGVDPIKTLGKVAKRAMGHFLDLEHVLDLRFGQNTLFDEQLANWNSRQVFFSC